MGRRYKKGLDYCFVIITVILVQNFSASQTTILGSVKNVKSNLQSVSVILKDSLSESIITYSYSDSNGNYELKTNKLGTFHLVFNSLGYKAKTIPFTINSKQREITINVVLEDKTETLDEVIIQSERPISIKKDTINFKTKYFVNGTEQTVEELLKKIPGLEIDNEGTIKVGNKEIEKLMIDGDDLFEKGYKILSKNMPAYPIEEVEILKNYSNNRLLKGIEKSDKVALNLKLDEKSKNIWFGNMETSIGNDNFYKLKGNLANFGKKNKYYFLTNLNNIGYDAVGDIEDIVRPFRFNEPASIGDNQSVNSLLNLYENSPLGEKPKAKKAKKAKKETTESKLAEIEKNGKIATMELQIEALYEIIEGKKERISMVTEDDSLSELVDKAKMKEMQREVKVLEKRKEKMEKVYEKMCGKSYKRMVGEASNDNSNLGSNDNSNENSNTNPETYSGQEKFRTA